MSTGLKSDASIEGPGLRIRLCKNAPWFSRDQDPKRVADPFKRRFGLVLSRFRMVQLLSTDVSSHESGREEFDSHCARIAQRYGHNSQDIKAVANALAIDHRVLQERRGEFVIWCSMLCVRDRLSHRTFQSCSDFRDFLRLCGAAEPLETLALPRGAR
jgi:hypothetical protein